MCLSNRNSMGDLYLDGLFCAQHHAESLFISNDYTILIRFCSIINLAKKFIAPVLIWSPWFSISPGYFGNNKLLSIGMNWVAESIKDDAVRFGTP